MKKPILYRAIMYSILGGLCISILFLLNLMNRAPFSSKNMRSAYFGGCNVGLHARLTDESVARCNDMADIYKETLDDMDRQLNDE